MKKNVTPGETPAEITISMIDQDLKDGVTKPEMAIKYGIKPWEVDEMFKHPFLKGRRPLRKRTLSFKFVDDMSEQDDLNAKVAAGRSGAFKETFEAAQEALDPKQVTLEQAIDDAIEDVEEAKNQMQETQEAIVEMLSPTEFETPEETLLKAANGSTIDELDAAEPMNEQEDEIEMDDDTFEL